MGMGLGGVWSARLRLVLPLMKLPRIAAYRESIKPSQIIPPSRLPARRHDITSWQLLPLHRAGLDCALRCATLWPRGTVGTGPCQGLISDTSAKTQSLPRHRPELLGIQASQRN